MKIAFLLLKLFFFSTALDSTTVEKKRNFKNAKEQLSFIIQSLSTINNFLTTISQNIIIING